MSAKDQKLRILIAHARLYDDLDSHVAQIRARREPKPIKEPPKVEAAVSESRKKASRSESRGHAAGDKTVDQTGKVLWTESDLAAAECALYESDCEDSLSTADSMRSVPQDLSEPHRKDTSKTKTHGSPIILEKPVTFNMAGTPNRPGGISQTIVSEIPIDDSSSSESDSDSDSDSQTDYDSGLDMKFDAALNSLAKSATPVTISRPKSPHPCLRRDCGNDSSPNPACPIEDPLIDDTLPALERSPAASPGQRTVENQSGSNMNTSPLKTSPLLPQLCEFSTNNPPCIEEGHPLEQALRQLRESCNKKRPHQNVILQWLSSLASWSPSAEPCEIDCDVHDEKLS
ncbi:MAG: hypothetical protein Q9170_003936 [Blastenia crenularia]